MAYSIIHSEAYERDYLKAVDYLEIDCGNVQAAKKLVSGIRNASSILASTPFIRAVSTKRHLQKNELREYFVDNYTIVYRVRGATVELVRLFHQSQQYDNAIKDSLVGEVAMEAVGREGSCAE